ncbi:MAG TPA: glycosyltransferase family 1 protein [Sphingomicrobium sp.]|nr:glycosyltransferase family 1 protein [Sphingomicrobium sp.]
MRVALFSGNYNYVREGANQALNKLVGYAERQGCKVRVYSPVTETPAFEPEGELVPVPSVRLPVRGEFRLALGIPRHIRKDITNFSAEVVHVSTPDILGTRAQTLAKQMGVPVLASLHTRFETYFEHYGLGWARPLAEAHLRRFYCRSDHVLAPTPAIVEQIKRLRGDDRVSLWSRGIDRDRFSPGRRDVDWRRANGFGDDDVVLLFFGRLVLEKGIRNYIRILLALRKLGLPIRPLIVGDGPARNELDALDGAILTGHLDGVELGRAVASADILLQPSRTEAFGNVVLEAMASGLAVVCADADSARGLVDDRRSGLLYRNEAEAIEGVSGLVRDRANRTALGAAAQEASARFSWDAASQSVLDAYRAVLEPTARYNR